MNENRQKNDEYNKTFARMRRGYAFRVKLPEKNA